MMQGPCVGTCSIPSMLRPNQRCSTRAIGGRSARWSRGASRRSATSTRPAARTVPMVPRVIAWSPGAGEAVARDGGVVLLDGGRELVVLVVLLHEEEVLDRGRIEDSVDRAEAGIGDRPGREPRPLGGVVGVIDRKGGLGQRRPVRTDSVSHDRGGLLRGPPTGEA